MKNKKNNTGRKDKNKTYRSMALLGLIVIFLMIGSVFAHAESEGEGGDGEDDDEGSSWNMGGDFEGGEDDDYRALPPVVQVETPPLLNITEAEVSAHNTSSNCWISIYGYVLDLNGYAGPDNFDCGRDNTPFFQAKYGADLSTMGDYYIGDLIGYAVGTQSLTNTTLEQNVSGNVSNESNDSASSESSVDASALNVESVPDEGSSTAGQTGSSELETTKEKGNIFVMFWRWLGF